MVEVLQGLGHCAASAPRLIQEVISLIPQYRWQVGESYVSQELTLISHVKQSMCSHHTGSPPGFVPHCSVQRARKEDLFGSSGVHSASFILLGRETGFPPCSFQKDLSGVTVLFSWALPSSLPPFMLKDRDNTHCFSFLPGLPSVSPK